MWYYIKPYGTSIVKTVEKNLKFILAHKETSSLVSFLAQPGFRLLRHWYYTLFAWFFCFFSECNRTRNPRIHGANSLFKCPRFVLYVTRASVGHIKIGESWSASTMDFSMETYERSYFAAARLQPMQSYELCLTRITAQLIIYFCSSFCRGISTVPALSITHVKATRSESCVVPSSILQNSISLQSAVAYVWFNSYEFAFTGPFHVCPLATRTNNIFFLMVDFCRTYGRNVTSSSSAPPALFSLPLYFFFSGSHSLAYSLKIYSSLQPTLITPSVSTQCDYFGEWRTANTLKKITWWIMCHTSVWAIYNALPYPNRWHEHKSTDNNGAKLTHHFFPSFSLSFYIYALLCSFIAGPSTNAIRPYVHRSCVCVNAVSSVHLDRIAFSCFIAKHKSNKYPFYVRFGCYFLNGRTLWLIFYI